MLYLLIGLTSVVVAILLWVLWRHEARQQAVTIAMPAISLTAAVMAVGALLYIGVGLNKDTDRWLSDWREYREFARQVVAGEPDPQLAANVPLQSLARVLQRQLHLTPSAEGWYVLALVYAEMEAPKVAVTAARKAVELAGDELDPRLLLARSLIEQNGGKLDAEASAILDDVLRSHPDHDGALTLLASAAMQSRDYARALPAWQALLNRHGEGEARPLLEKMVADAQRQLQSQLYYQGITVTVDADVRVQAGGTLFVFLRRPGDVGQPLAAVRVLADGFPMTVSVLPENWLQEMPTPGTQLEAGARYSDRASAGIEGAVESAERVALTGEAGQLAARLNLSAVSK
ncbi:cytochrome C biogenesis protein [Alcanivorax sp. 1008]|uniref:tetratricopeptide repeat protein n=1 Tax=Alcanivorax sp. 1008 TaxID=2816853 RepID=UPI001DEC7E8C|nr:cytochrome C biogenesis protein [Alcanivorax sp. 1008]MCC1495626.1 cytochrome C biogenesis protein [Alcanivorax sp. 1008]